MSKSENLEKSEKLAALHGGAGDLRKYTQQIWLAGLGAFSRAEEEGSKFFDTLVAAGQDVESVTREKTEASVEGVKAKVKDVKGRTGETLGRMERAFDDRLNGALARLGIPNKREVDELNSKIKELTETIEKLNSVDE